VAPAAAERQTVQRQTPKEQQFMSPLEIVQSAYAAFAKGDVPAVLGILESNMSWTEAAGGPYGGVYVGPQAVLQGVFMRLGTEWDNFAAIPHEFVSNGDTVVALGEYTATFKATGKSLKTPFAHVWKLREGKAISFHQYTDTAAHQACCN
jgi:hypothetical protein